MRICGARFNVACGHVSAFYAAAEIPAQGGIADDRQPPVLSVDLDLRPPPQGCYHQDPRWGQKWLWYSAMLAIMGESALLRPLDSKYLPASISLSTLHWISIGLSCGVYGGEVGQLDLPAGGLDELIYRPVPVV